VVTGPCGKTSWAVQPQSTVDAPPLDGTQTEGEQFALSSLAHYMATRIMNWIRDFFTQVSPTLCTKSINLSITIHCATQLTKIKLMFKLYSTISKVNIQV